MTTTRKPFLCNTCLTETETPGRHCTGTAIADHDAARVTAARRNQEPVALAETREIDHAEALILNAKIDAVVSVDLPMTIREIAETLASAIDTRSPRFLVEAEAHIENRRRNEQGEGQRVFAALQQGIDQYYGF